MHRGAVAWAACRFGGTKGRRKCQTVFTAAAALLSLAQPAAAQVLQHLHTRSHLPELPTQVLHMATVGGQDAAIAVVTLAHMLMLCSFTKKQHTRDQLIVALAIAVAAAAAQSAAGQCSTPQWLCAAFAVCQGIAVLELSRRAWLAATAAFARHSNAPLAILVLLRAVALAALQLPALASFARLDGVIVPAATRAAADVARALLVAVLPVLLLELTTHSVYTGNAQPDGQRAGQADSQSYNIIRRRIQATARKNDVATIISSELVPALERLQAELAAQHGGAADAADEPLGAAAAESFIDSPAGHGGIAPHDAAAAQVVAQDALLTASGLLTTDVLDAGSATVRCGWLVFAFAPSCLRTVLELNSFLQHCNVSDAVVPDALLCSWQQSWRCNVASTMIWLKGTQ